MTESKGRGDAFLVFRKTGRNEDVRRHMLALNSGETLQKQNTCVVNDISHGIRTKPDRSIELVV